MTDERKAFEAWAVGKRWLAPSLGVKDLAWMAWQARAALTQGEATAAPLPSSPESAGSHRPMPDPHPDDHGRWASAAGVAQEAGAREPMDAEHWAELYRIREEVKGPDGFATWKDAAIAERLRTTGAIEALRRSLDDLYAQSYGLRGNFHEGYCKAIDDVRAALAPPSP
jgi:hypothetical protein